MTTLHRRSSYALANPPKLAKLTALLCTSSHSYAAACFQPGAISYYSISRLRTTPPHSDNKRLTTVTINSIDRIDDVVDGM
jgi:hypothetical protein